jgi:hypothetical protein
MNKVFKYISALFLLLAGAVMVVHQTIPHDHHLSESVNNQDDSCPFSKHKTDHHPVLPVHCHAFNDLASEKVRTFVLRDNFQNTSLIFHYYKDVFAFDFDLQLTLVKVLDSGEPVTDSHILELSLLRAPPSII